MKLGILVYTKPREEGAPHANIQRLIDVGQQLGHTVDVLYEPLLSFHQNSELRVMYGKEPLTKYDVILNRANFTEEPTLHTVTMELLTKAGYRLVNGHLSVYLTKNKLHQHAIFAEADIPCPRWSVIFGPEGLEAAADALKFPIIAKVAFGTHGKGVFYADTLKTLRPIVDYLTIRDENPVILEEFVGETDGADVRAFVVGGEDVACMQRQAMRGEVRANIGAGGTGEKTELSETEKRAVLHAARAFHLEICGVDFLRSNRGPLVLEVNANPGFEELEHVTGIDVAKAIIEYSVRSASLKSLS